MLPQISGHDTRRQKHQRSPPECGIYSLAAGSSRNDIQCAAACTVAVTQQQLSGLNPPAPPAPPWSARTASQRHNYGLLEGGEQECR